MTLTVLELCAGAGGQALGLEQAGFQHQALVEIDAKACQTLQFNRPDWHVLQQDIKDFSAASLTDVDLVAAGVPCPPFSVASKQLGAEDERDLFPEAVRIIAECRPRAILLENVKGLLQSKFADYRIALSEELMELGYQGGWQLLNACDFGVPQLRPRAVFVAFRDELFENFIWPEPQVEPLTVGETLRVEMGRDGWERVDSWAAQANKIAPTLVGGSKKHGGPDLGPTRSKKAWAALGVDGHGIAYEPPTNGFTGFPRLTVKMAALIQGFPDNWVFVGKKTPAYRQVGNAFPPPVAKGIGLAICQVLCESGAK